MRLLSPLSLAWLGLVVPLVLLYVLRRRRQRRTVGSTLLWQAALRDLRAERPWRRLIPHVSLLLQLLVLLLGVLALARPAGLGAPPAGAQVAVVVDLSASMAADAGDGHTRIAQAQDAARALLSTLPPGGRGMVVAAGREAVVVAPPTQDTVALGRAVGALAVDGGRADLSAAVDLAVERLTGAPAGSRVVVLSDLAEGGSLALAGLAVPVELRRVGRPADNTGIVALDARSDPTPAHPDRASLFVRLRRAAEEPRSVYVLATAGGGLVASRRVEMPARGELSINLPADLPPDSDGRAPVVVARVAAADDGHEGAPFDALPLDDVRVAPSPAARRLPVFYVGQPVPSVVRVLRSDPEVELYETTLGRLAARDADAPPLDGLFVYAGGVPEQPPPGDSVVVAPRGHRVFELEIGPSVAAPRVVSWDEDAPQMRFVSLADVHFASARSVHHPGARGLVTTTAGPVVASYERVAGETTVLSFDPSETDWPTQPSFVVFFRNLLERARSRRAQGGVPAAALGTPLSVPAPDGETVTVVTPDGDELSAVARGGLALVPVGAAPGVYRVRAGGRELFALRNLEDADEIDLGARLVSTDARGAAAAAVLDSDAEPRESWPWLALAALFVLLLETAWATRRSAA